MLFGGGQGIIRIRRHKKTHFLIKSENNNQFFFFFCKLITIVAISTLFKVDLMKLG